MQNKYSVAKGWIKEWFNECSRNGVNPWEWDFKQSYSKEIFSPIIFMLKYKNYELLDIGKTNTTGKVGKGADCDKEPFYIYHTLDWQVDKSDIIRGETMNSFITTFNNAIYKSDNKGSVYYQISINESNKLVDQLDVLYKDNNFEKFDLVKRNLEGFELFANRTHAIGNFTVLPHWMNTGRYNFSKDYWDITLKSLFDFLHPIGGWKSFVEKYFLQPFVNDDEDLTVDELWEGHFSGKIYPQNEKDYYQFLNKVNLRIEERGKIIIKELCEKLEESQYQFYKEIRNMKIRFSNQIY